MLIFTKGQVKVYNSLYWKKYVLMQNIFLNKIMNVTGVKMQTDQNKNKKSL